MIWLHSILDNSYKYFSSLNNKLSKFNYNYQKHTFISINLKRNKFILISKWNSYIYLSSRYLLKNNLNYQFISRNFWDKFVNQYWQETLFISANNTYSDYYINQLKASGLSVNKGNQNKKFLLNFSKDLMNGKIQVALTKDKVNSFLVNRTNDKYIKYVWRKSINWYIYNLYSKYLFIKNHLLKNKYLSINQYVDINTLPLFTVTNQNNQIIISESPDQIFLNKYFLKSFYNIFTSKKNYTGLLFISPKDALEYKYYSTYKYLSLNNNLLKLFVSRLGLYYKLLYSSIYNTEFRLIPDLKEISNLIYKYQYYTNVSFQKSQKYGKDYFQGQPVYMIKPILVKNIHTRQKHKLDYFYNINKSDYSVRCQAIFLNYQTALLAWKKFRQDYPSYKIPAQPNIFVSNLEYFIKSQTSPNSSVNYMFIPSLETYNFVCTKNLNSQ